MFSNKDLRKLLIPLILEQTLVMMVGFVDTVMVSFVGEAAMSGVSLVDMINILIFNILAALATGGAVVASQYVGAGNRKKASESAFQLYLVVGLIAVVIAALCVIFNRHMLSLLFGSIEQEVMDSASIYLLISAASYPFIALYNGGAALFRSMRKTNITFKVSLFMNVVNIIFNALLIFWVHLGAAGVALGSLISRGAGALIMTLLLMRKDSEIRLTIPRPRLINIDMMKRILSIGLPNGFEGGMFQFGRILVVSIISEFGTVQIAANAVANNLDGITCIPGNAIGLAMITVVGQCVGAGDYTQARANVRKLIMVAYCCFVVMAGGLVLTLSGWLSLYSLSGETIVLARLLIIIHALAAILFWTPSFVLPNALRAAGDVRYTMGMSIFSMWVFRIMFSYILGKYMGMGAIGVWIAMILDWLFRDAAFITRFHGHKWEEKKVI